MEISKMVMMGFKWGIGLCVLLFSSLYSYGQMENNAWSGNTIAFASDTQAPLWIESVFLKDRQNKRATGLVFEEIIKRHPLALFLLGDVVSLGYSDRAWIAADIYLKTARKSGIPVYAVLGNHELMQRSKTGEQKFQIRFPEHKRTGYVQVIDSVAVILLNSNFSSLSKTEALFQQKWLSDTLLSLDSNRQVKGIIMACHHPPYTNSKLVQSNKEVQEYFVKPFLEHKKCILFITGHSHAFEYFKAGGKDFLIIGGGGGLQHPLNDGPKKLNDEAALYKPLFHFLTITIKEDELRIVSHQLKTDFSGFEDGFSIKIPFSDTKALH